MREIIEYFKKCPCLFNYDIKEDYLGSSSTSICIAHNGGEVLIKSYASGDMLKQINFKLMLREFFTGQAGELFDGISSWIEHNDTPLPILSEDRTCEYIEVTKGPSLVKTEVSGGVYEMSFRLVYYLKGVKDE